MSRDTTADDSRLTRRQRHVAILLAVVCIVLTSAALVAAQDTFEDTEYTEGWESGDLDGYTVNEIATGSISVSNNTATEGEYSLRTWSESSSYSTVEWNDTLNIGYADPRFTAEWDWHLSGQSDTELRLSDGSEHIAINFRAVLGGRIEIRSSIVENYVNPGGFQFGEWQTVRVKANGTHTSVYVEGQRELTVNTTGQWDDPQNVTVQFRHQTDTGGFDSETYTDDVYISANVPEVDIDANGYMRPNTTQHYTVTFNETDDVTGQANVTTSDSDVLSVDNGTLVATGNASELPAEVTVTAEYQGITDSRNVTVAKPSVENLDILPTWWKVNATVGDGMMLWLIVATLAAVVATRGATSFAGVGAYVMIMICGWIAGPVSDGVMIAAILTGLFLGMNLAANVDTTIRGTG